MKIIQELGFKIFNLIFQFKTIYTYHEIFKKNYHTCVSSDSTLLSPSESGEPCHF